MLLINLLHELLIADRPRSLFSNSTEFGDGTNPSMFSENSVMVFLNVSVESQ